MINTREVEYSNKFKKLYKKMDLSIRVKAKETILELKNNPFPKNIKVHKLGGKLSDYYSCSIDYSHRIIFEIGLNGKITLLLIGNHDIYK